MMNYFSLDLELNNKNDGTVPKIIQVGVAIGSPGDIRTYSWYVNPGESITPFITELTGIDDALIAEKSVPLSQVAEELGNLLTETKPFTNPIVWGHNDANQLKNEFKENGIRFPFFGYRTVDVKTLYVFLEQSKERSSKGGLRGAMNKYNCPFVGTQHRAEVDAYNTLVFYFFLKERQAKLEQLVSQLKTL